MSPATVTKLVFGCPGCKHHSEWPKNAFGEYLPRFQCALCGALGEETTEGLPDLLLLLKNCIDEDLRAVQNAAEWEKTLEALSEIGYSSPDETPAS